MKFQRKIGAHIVIAECGEDLAAQAESLLTRVAECNAKGPAIGAGTTIQFGWSLLTLRDNGKELYICEPNFAGDPHNEVMPLVDDTLRVLTRQIGLLGKVGVQGVDVLFSNKIFVARNCLEAEHIYLVRDDPANENDSGWYIGKFGETEADKSKDHVIIMEVYEVYNQRYSVMDALTLPPGYKATYWKDLAEAIMAPNGKVSTIG